MQSLIRISSEGHNDENKFSSALKEPAFFRTTKQAASQPSHGQSILLLPVLLDRKRHTTPSGPLTWGSDQRNNLVFKWSRARLILNKNKANNPITWRWEWCKLPKRRVYKIHHTMDNFRHFVGKTRMIIDHKSLTTHYSPRTTMSMSLEIHCSCLCVTWQKREVRISRLQGTAVHTSHTGHLQPRSLARRQETLAHAYTHTYASIYQRSNKIPFTNGRHVWESVLRLYTDRVDLGSERGACAHQS
jgi:hypothetical protein